MDDIVRNTKNISAMKMGIETFIEKFNKNEVVILDVRVPAETKLWGLKFAIEIPYNQLPARLDELPKDKTIVCVCPNEYRSNMAKEYLRFKGFHVCNLESGLLGLMARLKGEKAKDLKI